MKKLLYSILLTPAIIMSLGCNNSELMSLRKENQELKSELQDQSQKMNAKQQEIDKLKETPDFHYQNGVKLLNDKDFEGSIKEFETVISNWPNHLLAAISPKQIKIARDGISKAETEKRDAERAAKEGERISYDTFYAMTESHSIQLGKRYTFRARVGQQAGDVLEMRNPSGGNLKPWVRLNLDERNEFQKWLELHGDSYAETWVTASAVTQQYDGVRIHRLGVF
ncbi:MAG: hypothetical protein ABSH53_06560 [Holophaga sp.]|jgi:hypothetical protein